MYCSELSGIWMFGMGKLNGQVLCAVLRRVCCALLVIGSSGCRLCVMREGEQRLK